MSDHVSTSSIDVMASPDKVWNVLTTPESVKKLMFGSEVITTWEVGSPVAYRGEWEGKAFEDHGVVVDFEPPRLLRTTHYSPMSGEPDIPENYHTVTYTLEETTSGARVTLEQDNNPTEEAAQHSTENWMTVLTVLKELAEA